MVMGKGDKACECVTCKLRPVLKKLDGVRERMRAPGVFEIMTAEQWEKFSAIKARDDEASRIQESLLAQYTRAGLFGLPRPEVDPDPHVEREEALLRDAKALADECEATLKAHPEEASRRRVKYLIMQDAGRRLQARMRRAQDAIPQMSRRDRKTFHDGADQLEKFAEPMVAMREWDETVVDDFSRAMGVMAGVLQSIGF